MLNQTFGQLFRCELINNTINPYLITLDNNLKHRILIISDTHLGASLLFSKSCDLFIEELKNLIEKENPTMIFHLGDLVNGTFTEGSNLLSDVLIKMNTLGVPIYYIGGNHDRDYLNGLLPKWNPLEYITPLPNNTIKISVPPSARRPNPTNLFFAHDLNNNYRVRDQHALSFVNWIKLGSNGIKVEDWLIIGHTHSQLTSFTSRTMCVGQFSPEINIYCYSIIDIDDTDLSLTTKCFPGKTQQK